MDNVLEDNSLDLSNNSEEIMTDENEGKNNAALLLSICESIDFYSLLLKIEHNYLSDYGMKWLKAWWETNNYKKWNQYTDHEIYEIVEPG